MSADYFPVPSVSQDYIEQRLRVLESQKDELTETAKWKGRNEVIALVLNVGTVFAALNGIPLPPITPGMVDWVWEKAKSLYTWLTG
jgi:hypothetical protein